MNLLPRQIYRFLKLGCTLPILANIYLHKATDAKFYPFTRGKALLKKSREDVVGVLFIVITGKALVDETFFRKSTNLSKFNFGIDNSPLYHYSLNQPMPAGAFTRWDLNVAMGRFTPAALKIWSCTIFNKQDQNLNMKASTLQADN